MSRFLGPMQSCIVLQHIASHRHPITYAEMLSALIVARPQPKCGDGHQQLPSDQKSRGRVLGFARQKPLRGFGVEYGMRQAMHPARVEFPWLQRGFSAEALLWLV